MIAVIGASGFVGKNIQEVLKKYYKGICSEFIMIYFNNYNDIDNCFNKISFKEFINNSKLKTKIESIIITSGNSNRNIIKSNFNEFLSIDTEYILNLEERFNANIILLSSAAVYDGKIGYVKENSNIMPKSLYGICKYNSEIMAKYIIDKLKYKKLIIYRLMYAYGKFEKDTRLFPAIAYSIKFGTVFTANGYENYLNPLSGEFIGKIFINTVLNIGCFPKYEVVNLSSLKKLKVIEILKAIKKYKNFNYKLNSIEPCLKYNLDTKKLEYYLNKLNLKKENTKENIINYIEYLCDL